MMTGVGVFLLYALLVLTIVVQSLLAAQQEKLDAMFTESLKIVQEGRTAITRLNALGFSHCDQTTLNAMQRQLFLSSRVRDIGFVRNNTVVCTTSAGILKEPFKQKPWSFIGPEGFKYWSAVPLILFNGTVQAPLLEKGQFNAILDSRWLEQQSTPGERRELIVQNRSTKAHYAYGDEGIFRSLKNDSGQQVSLSTVYSEACRTTPPFCAAVESENLPVLKRNLPLGILLVLIGITLGSAAARTLSVVLRKRRSTKSRVIRGVKQDAYYPLYQPIVDLETGDLVGCEVLARFRDSHGAIYPDTFIPLLAKAQLGWPFTELIMQKTLAELDPLNHLPDGFKIHINLYPSDIAMGRPRNSDITRALAESRFQIAFEVTEDEQLDTSAARDCLDWIKQNGFELSVDDFGTGYSNLSKLKDLECSTLKIDRSFVFDIDAGGLGYILVPHMIKLGRELGMDIVTEGVETLAQADIVKTMGARYAQGWAFGRPMTAKNLHAFCSKHIEIPA
jgi:sensor c-di-GMP phosphodiesterase-like protein